MKRLLTALAGVCALAIGVGNAVGADGGAQISTVSASFAPLSSDTCPFIPSGVSFSWSGPETQITNTRTDANGDTTLSVRSHAEGNATDQDGNEYAFNYSNQFRVTNTVSDPGTFSGTMTDHFSLAGHGIHLSNGFIATITIAFDENGNVVAFSADPINSRGDPISFPDGVAHCDPL